WTPPTAKAGARLPVLLWIYVGGFSTGSINQQQYSGAPLAQKGVVFVSIAYRLNALGFLAHPELTQESGHNASGNYGLLDEIAGLKWVQRNIAQFGGDPANVTIVGQSAGSDLVNLLPVSPLARGLFSKGIGWSGAVLKPGRTPDPQTLKEAEADGVKLQQTMKAKNLAGMRTVPWDRVLAASEEAFGSQGGSPQKPIVDGY